MKIIWILLGLIITGMTSAHGLDLYRVPVTSGADAEALRDAGVEVLMPVSGGYLVLVMPSQVENLRDSGLRPSLEATGVNRNCLVVDLGATPRIPAQFDVVYLEEQMRVLHAASDQLLRHRDAWGLLEMPSGIVDIRYRPGIRGTLPGLAAADAVLTDSLIGLVERDSIEAYSRYLEALGVRLTGTEVSRSAADWILQKFKEFGYSSATLDPFTGLQLGGSSCESFNVIAYKEGVTYSEQQIIIGAHYDAVPGSPGADDNGSGTAALLECARVLSDIPTDMTVIFIAFDSEESGLKGARHYVEGVRERNDDVVVMINMDMIGHHENSDSALIKIGDGNAYGELWAQLAEAYSGIDAEIGGLSSSDHWAFQVAGYDVVAVVEKIRSTHYHTSSDSCAYLNFDYMERMTQATVALVGEVDRQPPPLHILAVEEPGDGATRVVHWRQIATDRLSHIHLSYYQVSLPDDTVIVDLPPHESSYVLTDLTDGEEYCLEICVYDTLGNTSLVFDRVYFTPRSRPAAPFAVSAAPLRDAIRVAWSFDNSENDFDHCSVMRDGNIIAETTDTVYIDSSSGLGTEMHSYRVIAVDTGGTISDTVDIEPIFARAASLQTGRVLAVNRTQIHTADFADEARTGGLIQDALSGYDMVYVSDSTATTCSAPCEHLELDDLIDYEVVVVGAESGHFDDLAGHPSLNGVLEDIGYYVSIGGKAVIFGRWGMLGGQTTFDYSTSPVGFDDSYCDIFHINSRTSTPTIWTWGSPEISADLVGVRSRMSTFPHLDWDSLTAVAHCSSQDFAITTVNAIPCASFVDVDTSVVEVIYTYRSRTGASSSEHQPVAWRYFGDTYAYEFFDVPLSFFDHDSAVEVIRQAVDELLSGEPEPYEEPEEPVDPGDDPGELPSRFALSQNYPNPFNDGTRIDYWVPVQTHVCIEVFNILGQRVATLADGTMAADHYTVRWEGKDNSGDRLASGTYLYRIQAGEYVETRKMLLLK